MPFKQEKAQISPPDPEAEESHEWVHFEQFDRRVRDVHVTPAVERIEFAGGVWQEKLNIVPSTGIAEPIIEERQFKLVMAGTTDVSPISVQNIRDGFRRLPLAGHDDQYTNQSTRQFYDSVDGKDDAGNEVEGFVERANFLDRLAIAAVMIGTAFLATANWMGT